MVMAALLHLYPTENVTLFSFVPTRRKVKGNNLVKRLNKMIPTAIFSSSLSSSEEKVYEVVLKQAALVREEHRNEEEEETFINGDLLAEAYQRCGEVCAEYAKTFYLGTVLMTPERRRAVWAIYVWWKRIDDLVDGPSALHITPKALERWEKRLNDLFEGRPYDLYDVALSDTVSKYPVDIQPFKDMIEGMRLDLKKIRYDNFDELYLYCYYVASTVGLMSIPVMGDSTRI